jgi:5'-3' exonuclease
MGVPVLDAPGEAEAQCSAMARAGVVYGVATEDMDALTFGTPRCGNRSVWIWHACACLSCGVIEQGGC